MIKLIIEIKQSENDDGVVVDFKSEESEVVTEGEKAIFDSIDETIKEMIQEMVEGE